MMKNIIVLAFICLISSTVRALDPGPVPQDTVSQTFMFTHPATSDIGRDQALWHDINFYKTGPVRGAFQVIPFYQHSVSSQFSLNKQAGYFMPTCSSTALVAGDQSGMTLTRDVRAEWLNLPSNFSGIMSINPEQSQFGVVLDYAQDIARFTNNKFLDYFWVGMTLPIAEVKNNMNIRQYELANTSTSYVTPGNIIDAFNQTAWDFAKIDGEHKKSGLATCKLTLGALMLAEKGFEVNFYEYISFATSPYADPEFLFSPFLGNNHHWSMGTGGNFQIPLTYDDAKFPFLFFLSIEHQFLFHNKQYRTFDLKQNPWSRYLLYNSEDGTQVNVPGVNLLTRFVKVKPDSFVNLTTGFRLQVRSFEAELGYDLWARGAERVEFIVDVCPECSHPQMNILNFGIAGSGPGISASNSTINQQAADDASFVSLQAFDLNPSSATANAAICHRVHGSLGWTHQHLNFEAFVNIGGFAEFSQNNAALNLWGLWGKVGGSF